MVEDNPDDEALFMRALRRNGLDVKVHVARDGGEALEYLERRGRYAHRVGGPPRIILLDLKMPRVDGLEVLRRLHRDGRTEALAIIVFSSSSEPSDIEEAYRMGARSYVRKPVEYEHLLEAVKSILHYWLVLNEPMPMKAPSARHPGHP